jgi:hypothetical protein
MDDTYRPSLFMDKSITIVVFDCQTKARWVDVLVAPKKKGPEDRLGQEVEYAIEQSYLH